MLDTPLFEPLASNDRLYSGYRFRIFDPTEPPDHSVALEGAHLEGLQGGSLHAGDAVALDQHYIRAVAYTRTAGGKVSWFSSLFNVSANVEAVGVLQEAKSYMVGTIEGEQVEIGVAVLLKIEADKISAETQVSVANIAAEAQLGLSRAEMEISVRGFSGALGDMLPAPTSVDLTSYTQYLEAFEKIQKHVFGQGGQTHFSPVVLGKLRALPTG